ncbi:MAG: transcriptional repressor LexA [Eubacteriales bacterium]|nr:transcriptional repressor LexA [Eubacteriales bacterium]MDD4717271.1 transcriptional repressor LexA [Eubacteriales bacterium]
MKDSCSRINRFTRSNIGTTQEAILEFIHEFIEANGYPPAVREICEGTGIRSTSTVHSHLKKLTESGKLNYDSGRRRAISINADDYPQQNERRNDNVINIPLLGSVAAGIPILAQQNIETTLPFPSEFIRGSEGLFMLKVRGDSMIEAAILDGDHVIVRKQNSALPGDIVVALIDDEATVKTFKIIDGLPYLKPENPSYNLIPFYKENCSVIGKVVGVFRASV